MRKYINKCLNVRIKNVRNLYYSTADKRHRETRSCELHGNSFFSSKIYWCCWYKLKLSTLTEIINTHCLLLLYINVYIYRYIPIYFTHVLVFLTKCKWSPCFLNDYYTYILLMTLLIFTTETSVKWTEALPQMTDRVSSKLTNQKITQTKMFLWN